MGSNRDNFTMRLSAEIRARLQAVADRDQRSLAFVATQCLEGYLPVLEASASPVHAHFNDTGKKHRHK